MRRIETLAGLNSAYDLAVIGAGPAGMECAIVARQYGLSTVVLDEAVSPGGQIYRAITTAAASPDPVLGADYGRGGALVERFAASGADYLPLTAVWYLDEERRLGLSSAGKSRVIEARRVVLATGALERPFPIKGWTTPGVMAAGGAQTVLKASRMVPTGRVVLAGTGPLLWLVAMQLAAAGEAPTLMLDTTPSANWREALPDLGAFLISPYPWKGVRLLRRVRRAVRVVAGVTSLEIEADDQRKRVRYRRGSDRIEAVEFDHLLLHQGVVPNVNLASAAGCALTWNERQLCWQPQSDRWGNTTVPGIAIAGDGAGIAGAEVAAIRGRLAALEAAQALGAIDPETRDREAGAVSAALGRFERGRPFLDRLYRPAAAMRLAPPDAILCRCEEVTGAEVRDAAQRLGVVGANQLKTFLRCGMGPCQGRFCGLTVTETIADVHGLSPTAVGYFRLRPPVKPITLAELAAMDASAAEIAAVVRL